MKAALVLLFLSAIVAANWAVVNLPPVSVGFNQMAPAGVYLVAVILVLRDIVQRFSGVWGVAAAFVGGGALSFVLATPEVATASVLAFAVSFVVDTIIYTLMVRNGQPLWKAALASGVVSIVPDSYVFLHLIGMEQFLAGQILGKTYGTVLASAALGFERATRVKQ